MSKQVKLTIEQQKSLLDEAIENKVPFDQV